MPRSALQTEIPFAIKAYHVVCIILVVSTMLAGPVLAQVHYTSPTGITVTGQGEVSATPDIAHLNLGVVTQDRDAARAASENAARAQRVVEALINSGVARRDIQTTQYSIQPVYDYEARPPRLTGYQVSNIVRVNVRNLGQLGQLIDRAIAAGANNVQDISFEVENDTQLRNQALAEAVREANQKANVIATTAGVRLGALTAVNESVGAPIVPVVFARAEAAQGAPETPVLPGEVTVRATVTLVYVIVGGGTSVITGSP